ncbi:hypothetical protein FB451DRAFT_1187268 [Mycena latifolia]|nr:hypothetical protein FB451DRAFT_1187268 [Mycena latifolia]
MAPIRHLPTARDVDTATATATTDSDVPAPSSSTTLFGAPLPYLFPNWVGFLGLALFVCMLLATLYWVYRQSRPRGDQPPVAPQTLFQTRVELHREPRQSPSADAQANHRSPPPVYTAADNAAPGSEDDTFRHGTVINTTNNMRRPVQVAEKPLMVQAARPEVGSRL